MRLTKTIVRQLFAELARRVGGRAADTAAGEYGYVPLGRLLVICPIAIAYSMGRIIKSFCVCPCVRVCVRLWTLSRSHFFVDFHQIGHRRVNPQK